MYSRRQHQIEAIGAIIAEMPFPEPEWIAKLNQDGWTIEVRWKNGDYINDHDYTLCEGVVLSETELEQAMRFAEEIAT